MFVDISKERNNDTRVGVGVRHHHSLNQTNKMQVFIRQGFIFKFY